MIAQIDLQADSAKVKEAIEDIASTYQEPEEVINYYYSENEQLAQVESRVLEDQSGRQGTLERRGDHRGAL